MMECSLCLRDKHPRVKKSKATQACDKRLLNYRHGKSHKTVEL